MSDLSEKLKPDESSPGRARASWEQLQKRWGRLRVTEGTEQEPRIVELIGGDKLEIWRWLGGRGAKAIFELQGGE